MTQYVEWVEPWSTDFKETLILRLTLKDTISVQKKQAAKIGYKYESDQKALEDFMMVHWAKIVEGV